LLSLLVLAETNKVVSSAATPEMNIKFGTSYRNFSTSPETVGVIEAMDMLLALVQQV